MRTLVLNAGYEPMQLVNWKRALCLVLMEKAEIVSEYDEVIRSVADQFKLPSVVRLKRYVGRVKMLGWVRCTRRNILLRDNYHCQYCGRRFPSSSITIDHVIPKSKGGTTRWNNVVAACATCNRKKGSKSLRQFGKRPLKDPKRPSWADIMLRDEQHESLGDWLPWLGRPK